MNSFRLSSALAILFGCTLAVAGPVKAPKVPAAPSCAVSDTHLAALDCAGYRDGNTSLAAAHPMITAEGWLGFGALTEYKDDEVAFGSTISDVSLFDAVRTAAGDDGLGLVTFRQALTGPFVLAIKSGNAWAGCLFDGLWAAGSTISFDIRGRQHMGLSHVALYTSSIPVLPAGLRLASVPEPASWALVLAALGGPAARRLTPGRRRG